nr:hypothetical protein CFP56_70500 [Quercus suber]
MAIESSNHFLGDVKSVAMKTSSEVRRRPLGTESLTDAEDWHGSDNDRLDMQRLGKKQEFKRNFNFLSSLGWVSIYMY